MPEQSEQSETSERQTLPIERGFPIEKLNDLAEKEGRAKQWYRPLYTMHKWWARRLGCVFRTISLYTLAHDPENIRVYEPGENTNITDYSDEKSKLSDAINNVSIDNPDTLWQIYNKDVRIDNKRVLDPFMGGGTSIIENSRFGVNTTGGDLNPVAWFTVKKEVDAGTTDPEEFDRAFQELDEKVGKEVRDYYKTICPNGEHYAEVMYYQWVKELDCVSCGSSVPLFNDFRAGKARYDSGEYDVYCPDCGNVFRTEDWESECICGECNRTFVPSEGNVSRGDYTCPDCGQKYGIVDAVQEQDGFGTHLFTIDYYCPECDKRGENKDVVKGHKTVEDFDRELYTEAREEWENTEELRDYVPTGEIPLGIMTDSTAFEGSIGGGHNLLRHGYNKWTDLFNDRQLLSLSKILREICQFKDQNIKEFLLLAFSDALRSNTFLTNYIKQVVK